jgi:hypothetical protein
MPALSGTMKPPIDPASKYFLPISQNYFSRLQIDELP